MATPDHLSPIQLVGLLCWRGGLMLIASYGLFRTSRFLLTYVDLPVQLEVGFGLALAGAILVMGSLIAERRVDARGEELSG
jgi:hypothetical protein